MSARENILAHLRTARQGSGDSAAIEKYIEARGRGPAPALESDLWRRYIERAPRLTIDVERVSARADAPAALARYCETHALARRAVCWPELLALPWRAAGIDCEARAAHGDDAIGITGAFVAIAETVTLMLISGAETSASVSLVPETHVAIVEREKIVATMEDAWARLRARASTVADAMPRAVNFISGPSRTADVEQTVTLGAHGPRRVLVVVVGA